MLAPPASRIAPQRGSLMASSGRVPRALPWLLVAVLAACGRGGAADPSPAAPPSWAAVQRVFQDRCVSCHAGQTPAAGLRLDDWAALFAGSDHGEAIIPYDAERSLLVELAELHHPVELAGGTALTAAELATVRDWIAGGAPSVVGEVAYADSRDLVYVTNQGAGVVSVVDASAGVVVRTVDLSDFGYEPGAEPYQVVVEPDGEHWFVSLVGADQVLELDRGNRLIGSAYFEAPGMLAVHPTADLVYVARSLTAVDPPQRIGVIRPSDMTIAEVGVSLPRPHALAMAPGGGPTYAGSLGASRLAAVRLRDIVEVMDLPGSSHAFVHFAVAPDGGILAATTTAGELLFLSLAEDSMRPRLTGSLRISGTPWMPVFTPDGRYVFVTNNADDSVVVVEVASRSVVATIRHPGLAEPYGAAVSRDGTRLFVAGSNTAGAYAPRHPRSGGPPGTLTIIDAVSFEVLKVLEVEENPTGVGTRRGY